MEVATLLLSVQPGPKMPSTPPTQLVMERFNTLMNAPAEGTAGLSSQEVGLIAPASQFLKDLNSAASGYSENWRSISDRLESIGARPSMADMLRLQSDMLRISVQTELLGKAVSRSVQDVDTLVRLA